MTASRLARGAALGAGLDPSKVQLAELHASFTHQEVILRKALGLDDGVQINPSGGALCSDPLMVTGMTRIGEAATRLMAGDANYAVAHATSGPCLQQNLICTMEVE